MASSSASPTTASSSSGSPPRPPWLDLPEHITASILQKIGAVEMIETAQKVCTAWRKVCKNPSTWRVIDMENLGDLHDMPYDLEKMCRHAVDRSQGQLVDINIEYFGTDELLAYIAERSPLLRRLQLSCCYSVSGEGLSEAIRRFPLLEELHLNLIDISSIEFDEDGSESKMDLNLNPFTAIGRSCPLLKSLTYNGEIGRHLKFERDDEALAIGASMPNLSQLALIGNRMTNTGLSAILNGCPQLESLDLRGCINLVGDLRARCSQRIKDLRLPEDSLNGCRFTFEGDYCFTLGDYRSPNPESSEEEDFEFERTFEVEEEEEEEEPYDECLMPGEYVDYRYMNIDD